MWAFPVDYIAAAGLSFGKESRSADTVSCRPAAHVAVLARFDNALAGQFVRRVINLDHSTQAYVAGRVRPVAVFSLFYGE